MQTPRKILVVLDKPKHEQVALKRAQDLARAAGAHLHLASFCWLAMVEQTEVFDTHQRRAIRKSATHERQRWLEGLVLDSGLAAADVSTEVVWTKDIAGWVAEQAPARELDLVVKSVHHSRTLLHTPLDWELLRSCPVPLLLASTEKRSRTGNVLAAVDLEGGDAEHRRLNQGVIDAAARLAELEGAKLHGVNVVEVAGSFEDLEFFDENKMRKKAADAARARLRELLAPHAVPEARLHLPSGKVGRAVADVATAIGADVVVVGSGARRGLGALLLGSSAEKILTRAPCDVLAVHV
jgi:universal stress protein E